jgi:Fe2+ or Zn2+ uptake regulation protein
MTTIIEVSKEKSRPYINQLMKKLISNHCCLELLRFFVEHPNGRFSKLAILHAIDEDDSRLEVERSLSQLAEEGILKTFTDNNISFYILTRDEPMRSLVLNMALFNWREWQLVLEHV